MANFNGAIDEKAVWGKRERIGVDDYGNAAGESSRLTIFDKPKVSAQDTVLDNGPWESGQPAASTTMDLLIRV